ncbi:hypothetical protein ACFQLX_09325 [Streptomyces polyrhachis]|uniref:Uncharacterized protein n=1 Tax=Streptomyces polyrhachis TaxID=1282885 RepID=A0ABW2GHR4_9ACTN
MDTNDAVDVAAAEERDVADELNAAVADVRPDTRALVAGAVRRGGRIRRRRWALGGTAVGAVMCASMAVTVFGAYLPTTTLAGGEPFTPREAVREGAVTIPEVWKLPRRQTAPPGMAALTGRATVDILRDLLPGRPETSGYTGQDSWPKEGGIPVQTFGKLKVGGELTGRTVQINVQSLMFSASKPAELREFYNCARESYRKKVENCTVSNLPDGSVLLVVEWHEGLLISRSVDLLRPDGTRVVASTVNGDDPEKGPVTGVKPPLGLADLYRVVVSPRWQAYVDPEVVEEARALSPFDDRSQDSSDAVSTDEGR